MSYIIIASPYLLPGGKRKGDTALPVDDDGTILLGARLTKWSPAAGRTVKRSGLRDTGGVYLVSVYRARSGNIHRAVGQDFVLNVDDILYFTGMVDGVSSAFTSAILDERSCLTQIYNMQYKVWTIL